MTRIEKIMELCLDNDIEIVSYGLAPNPNGFCYECEDSTDKRIKKRLEVLLDSLSGDEKDQLIFKTFRN